VIGLAIESAQQTASAALWRMDGPGSEFELLDQAGLHADIGKADQLITLIEQLLTASGVTYQDLDLLAVNRGPGSFTGIRSAVALGRGLALASGLPVLGVTTHQTLAAVVLEETGSKDQAGRITLIAEDARRGQVYAQAFGENGQAKSEITAKTPGEVAAEFGFGRWRLAGTGAPLVLEHCSDDVDIQSIETSPLDAAKVAKAAAIGCATGETPISGFELRPLYVREPDAVPPRPLIRRTASEEAPR